MRVYPISQDLAGSVPPTPLDMHKAAGWWAGEGNVSWTGSSACISVAQKETDVLAWFVERFNGSVYQLAGGRTHAWVLAGRPARRFLLAIYRLIPESPRRRSQIKKCIIATAKKRKTGPVPKPYCRKGHPKTIGKSCKVCDKIAEEARCSAKRARTNSIS